MPTKKSTAKKVTRTKAQTKATTKKVVKKVVKKKTPAKKTSTNNKKSLVHADEGQAFWVTNGTILSNLLELKDALDSMDAEVFSHHVTTAKNDFADWVEFVLNDTDCAAALRKSKKPNAAQTVIVRHLKVYEL